MVLKALVVGYCIVNEELLLHSLSGDTVHVTHVGQGRRHDTVQYPLHTEHSITMIPRVPGLNEKQSATATHPPQLSSIFPQGTALSQPPSIMHQTRATNLLK